MSKKKHLLPFLIGSGMLALNLGLLISRLAHASGKPAGSRTSSGGSFESVDTFIKEQMERLNVPGAALAIVEGDQIVHLCGFGRARPGGEAPTPQTPFFIGSLTKSFTALAIMQLMEAGKVELDAPVQRYLPWFSVADPQASTQITVRHLLNQTSGLSTWSGWIPLADLDDRPDAAERQARALSTFKLTRPVGSAFEYSNMNYNLLGLIIEAASGESYAGYIQSHVFDPLGMRHSYTEPAEAKQNGLAVGHRYWFWSPMAMPDRPIPRGSFPSGQLVSSAEDMAHFLIAHLNGGRYGNAQILSDAGIVELHRPAAAADAMGWSGQYGMGWYNEQHGQTRIVWHAGAVPDFSAYMALLPEQKKGVVLLCNAGHFVMNPTIIELGSEAAMLLAGQQPAPSPFGFRLVDLAPWATRALLLIPLLQILGLAFTHRRLRGWREDPQRRLSRGRLWGRHILLPLIPNLSLVAAAVYLLRSKKLGFLRLFAPDFSWIALISGGFAGIWAFLRTGLVLGTSRKSQAPRSLVGQLGTDTSEG
jgi:CubicO group peptidase (beta-lactamase class C family)